MHIGPGPRSRNTDKDKTTDESSITHISETPNTPDTSDTSGK